MEDTRITRLSESSQHRTYELRKTVPVVGSGAGPQHMYYNYQPSSFMGFLSVRMSWSLTLVLALGTFLLLLGFCVCLQYSSFCSLLLHFTFQCLVQFLRSLFFDKERQKEDPFIGKVMQGGTGRKTGRSNYNQDILYGKIVLF